jgi:hypothetical protein
VRPIFRDNLNSCGYIVSKEHNQGTDSFISWEINSQAKSILSCLVQSGWRLSYIPGSYWIKCIKTKSAASSTFHAILRNKWINDARYGTADTRKARGNSIGRKLACTVARKLRFSVFPRVAMPLPQFELFQLIRCVQRRLITILGYCSCVAVTSSLVWLRP